MRSFLFGTVLLLTAALALAIFISFEPDLAADRPALASARIEPPEPAASASAAPRQAPRAAPSQAAPQSGSEAPPRTTSASAPAPTEATAPRAPAPEIIVTTDLRQNPPTRGAVEISPTASPANIARPTVTTAPAPTPATQPRNVELPAGVSISGFEGITVSIPPSTN